MQWGGIMKKYKVYIEWETEVEAKDHDEALIKGNDDFYFSYSDIDEAMSLIRVEEVKEG